MKILLWTISYTLNTIYSFVISRSVTNCTISFSYTLLPQLCPTYQKARPLWASSDSPRPHGLSPGTLCPPSEYKTCPNPSCAPCAWRWTQLGEQSPVNNTYTQLQWFCPMSISLDISQSAKIESRQQGINNSEIRCLAAHPSRVNTDMFIINFFFFSIFVFHHKDL